MSVDQRIREGLRMTNTQLLDPDTIHALELVTTRARTATRRRRLIVGGVAAAAAAAAVVVAVSVTGGDNAGQPLPADRTPSQPPETGAEAYLSDPVTFDDMAQNLREHGLGEWVEPLHDRWGDVDGRIRMEFAGQRLTASIPGTPVSHSGTNVIGERTGDIHPPAQRGRLWLQDVDSNFNYTATQLDAGGERLTLTLTQSGAPSIDGIPGEVYERALYTTVPFNEIPPLSQDELSPGTYVSDPVRFGHIASELREIELGSSVEPLLEKLGNVDRPLQVRLELDGDTATTSIPGTDIAFTGPYSTDGGLIRLDDADPRDDNGWIELVYTPEFVEGRDVVEFGFWNAGPAAWDGIPANYIATLFESALFTSTEE